MRSSMQSRIASLEAGLVLTESKMPAWLLAEFCGCPLARRPLAKGATLQARTECLLVICFLCSRALHTRTISVLTLGSDAPGYDESCTGYAIITLRRTG